MASRSEDDTPAAWVTLARILKTQGRHGEVAAEILTDIPGRFTQLAEVSLLHPSGRRLDVSLAAHWPHKGLVILKLAGLDDISSAEAWIGAEVQIPRDQRAPAPPGTVFVTDLVGCTVTAGGRDLGPVTAGEEIAGAPALLHLGNTLIPFVESYIVTLDLAGRRLDLSLPDGLLEI